MGTMTMSFQTDEEVSIRITGEIVTFKLRCNKLRKPKVDGLYALVIGPEGERVIKHSWLVSMRPVAVDAPAATCSPAPEPTQPARCESRPSRASWKDNVKRGAIYLDEEPGGTYRAALVCPKPDEPGGEQVANARGLQPDDLEDQLIVLVRRLVRRAREQAATREEIDAS
jgi:hypothetical protein